MKKHGVKELSIDYQKNDPSQNEIAPMKFSKMTAAEKREMLMMAIETGKIPPSRYDRMLYAMGMIKFEPGPHVLENGMVLEDLILQWAKGIKPEKLAGVLAALRDCDDPVRRRKIMYAMISAAYRQAGTTESEEEWRRRVESKLRKQ